MSAEISAPGTAQAARTISQVIAPLQSDFGRLSGASSAVWSGYFALVMDPAVGPTSRPMWVVEANNVNIVQPGGRPGAASSIAHHILFLVDDATGLPASMDLCT